MMSDRGNILLLVCAVYFFCLSTSFAMNITWPDNWRFVGCKQEHVAFVKSVFVEDLPMLANLNPELVLPLYQKAQFLNVSFDCKKSTSRSSIIASVSYRPWWQLGTGPDATVILHDVVGTSWTKKFRRQAIFHEFLHVLGFDTLSRTVHNSSQERSVKGADGIIIHHKDLVYACTTTLFPGNLMDIYFTTKRRSMTSCSFVDARDACMSCLSAQVDSNGKPFIPIDAHQSDVLKAFCEELHSEDLIEHKQIIHRNQDQYHPKTC